MVVNKCWMWGKVKAATICDRYYYAVQQANKS